MVSGGQRAGSGGNVAGTVRAEAPAVMTGEVKIVGDENDAALVFMVCSVMFCLRS